MYQIFKSNILLNLRSNMVFIGNQSVDIYRENEVLGQKRKTALLPGQVQGKTRPADQEPMAAGLCLKLFGKWV